ncbi:MAG TPA: uracil-DNA glycosylase [Pseudolabrys sp.]|nr:uracil-DNA glycosylase [Pseudolabrys sp.]
MPGPSGKPGRDCPRCPRLAAFRKDWRKKETEWFNAPVPSFGPVDARVLIVGLAPGLQGANRTGRPFTGDYAGVLLYETLGKYGFTKGEFKARPDDGLELVDCRITNAVRCVPPENKPLPVEINTCRDYLKATIAEMESLRVIVALGQIAHNSVLSAFAARKSASPFKHGGRSPVGHVTLFSSYHCSRYNTNTRVLTTDMFRAVFKEVRQYLKE